MKITNLANLPPELVSAVKNDTYSSGGADYSVTQLIAPAQQVALKKKHANEIVNDAADLMWMLLGRAVHKVIELADVPDSWREQRKSVRVKGLKISGQVDIYNPLTKTITDAKSTSVYRTKDGLPKDWENQLNLYAALWRLNGFPVGKLRVLTLYRDWRQSEALRNKDYPKTAAQAIDVPVWDQIEAQDYLRARISFHESAKNALESGGSEALSTVTPCTSRERWATPDRWAVMKKGLKRATKLFESEAEAAEMVANKGEKYFVEERPGEDRRCQNYCDAAPFCNQYRGRQ